MAPAARLRRSSQMRFMFIVKSAHPFGPPTPQFLEAMNKLADREIKAGRLLDNGGVTSPPPRAPGRLPAGPPSAVRRPVVEGQGGRGGQCPPQLASHGKSL